MVFYDITYSLSYVLCALLLGALVFRMEKSVDKQQMQLWFIRTTITHMMVYGLLMVRGILAAHRGVNAWLLYIIEMVTYIGAGLAVCMWVFYLEMYTDPRIMSNKVRVRRIMLPFVAVWILNATSQWTELFYYVGPGKIFIRTAGDRAQMAILLVIEMFFTIRLLLNMRYEESSAKKGRMITVAMYAFFTTGAEIIRQLSNQRMMPMFCFSTTLALLNIYMSYLTHQISMDPLTQINNRNQLLRYIERKMGENNGKLYILMMDVNHFKSINDRFGHVEGDAALVKVSDSLKQACVDLEHRAFISRYGGDEFIIVAEVDDDADIERLCGKIHRTLSYCNTWSNAPYDLTISIGVARYRPEFKKPADFIAEADQALYEEKKKRKSLEAAGKA